MHRIPHGALLLLLALNAVPDGVSGQDVYRISERSTLTQRLGKTKLSIDYSRPVVRGRADVFGKVVTWGELWTPGANEATVLETDQPIKLNGHELRPGRWSMWVIPSRVGKWELVLDPRDSLFHTERPELKESQVRFPLDVKQDAPHTEVLTWTFPRVAHDGATMQMNWGSTQIALEVGVESIRPSHRVDAAAAAPFLGEWKIEFMPDPKTGKTMAPTVLTVSHKPDASVLTARIPPGVFAPPPDTVVPASEAALSPIERERAEARRTIARIEQGEFRYALIPRAAGIFVMGYTEQGELLETYDFFHEFELENGRAVRLTLRDDKDQVIARGTRARK